VTSTWFFSFSGHRYAYNVNSTFVYKCVTTKLIVTFYIKVFKDSQEFRTYLVYVKQQAYCSKMP